MSPDKFEPEYAIEHSNLALCVISGQGELRYRDPPAVIKGKGGPMVFTSFVAQTDEVGRQHVIAIPEADNAEGFPIIRV